MRPDGSRLEAIAGALHPVLGDWVRDGSAEVAAYPVPGMPVDAVWRVRMASLDHPVQAYVGTWPDGSARALNDDQDAFLDLARATGVEIADANEALGYVLAFLEATRGPIVIVRPIAGVADIAWRPGTDEEETRRTAFLRDAVVQPPTARASGEGFVVEAWLVVDQRIQRNTFTVARDGGLSATHHVVAADLPLPIAR
jgi:hypothetical protein